MSQLTPEEREALEYYSYGEPQPIRHEPRFRLLRRLFAPIAVAVGLAIKFGAFTFKFFGIFISVAAYALIWGWKFAVGLVLLLLVHELGHFIEAKRQGLDVSLPRFIPFIGAYVLIRDSPVNPWRNALVALAGPALGGLGSALCLGVGQATDSGLLQALGYTGFLLNLFNLIPVAMLDGGAIWRAYRLARAEPLVDAGDLALGAGAAGQVILPGAGRSRALAILVMYIGLAGLLALGMFAAHVPQDRI